MPMGIGIGLSITRGEGVPDTITVNGVVWQRLYDASGQPLADATGQALYGKKVS